MRKMKAQVRSDNLCGLHRRQSAHLGLEVLSSTSHTATHRESFHQLAHLKQGSRYQLLHQCSARFQEQPGGVDGPRQARRRLEANERAGLVTHSVAVGLIAP